MMNDITQDRLRELLRYNSETGVFHWLVSRGGTARSGSEAGTRQINGYIYINVDGRLYLAHRMAWLYTHGRWPVRQIDHINGVRDDNRIDNLRECSNAENMQNLRRANSNNISGLRGASFHKGTGRWVARVMINGKDCYLGLFDTPEEAHQAYLDAKSGLHPFSTHARDNIQ